MISGPISSYIDGVVARANERGVMLEGETTWRNISKWANPVPAVPDTGSLVRLGLDAAGFVRCIGATAMPMVSPPGWGQSAPADAIDRDRRIVREAVLNTAVSILSSHGAVDPHEVVELAARLEAWVLC